MKQPKNLATIHALRDDVALQIARFIQKRELGQGAAASLLDVSRSTLSKIANGRGSELSLEFLIRLSVKAGLQLVLQTGSIPAEAGAHLSSGASAIRTGSSSRLAQRSRDDLLTISRAMTPEQRLNAQLEHSMLVAALLRSGERAGRRRLERQRVFD